MIFAIFMAVSRFLEKRISCGGPIGSCERTRGLRVICRLPMLASRFPCEPISNVTVTVLAHGHRRPQHQFFGLRLRRDLRLCFRLPRCGGLRGRKW
jgi:hypothetical protein